MGLSVSEGRQGVRLESVFVWSFSFWNECVLEQNYTKMCCQETLSFVSMSLQIFPNKFDVSQSVPAFILPNKSFSLRTTSPGLAGSSGSRWNEHIPALTVPGSVPQPHRGALQLLQGVSL